MQFFSSEASQIFFVLLAFLKGLKKTYESLHDDLVWFSSELMWLHAIPALFIGPLPPPMRRMRLVKCAGSCRRFKTSSLLLQPFLMETAPLYSSFIKESKNANLEKGYLTIFHACKEIVQTINFDQFLQGKIMKHNARKCKCSQSKNIEKKHTKLSTSLQNVEKSFVLFEDYLGGF